MSIGTSTYPTELDTETTLVRATEGVFTTLRFPVGASDTTIPVSSTEGMTPDGAVLVEGECISYTGLSGTELTGCTRGVFRQDGYGPAVPHPIGAEVAQPILVTHVRVLGDAVRVIEWRVERLGIGVSRRAVPLPVADPPGGTPPPPAYTLAAADYGWLVTWDQADALPLTVPAGLPAGFRCRIAQVGTGRITVAPASGVTVSNRAGHAKTAGQHAVVELLGIGTNAYILTGDTGA